jgi:hypothetical protein
MATYTLPPFIREPADVYRSKRSQFLTSHQLADFRFCPLYYRRKQAGLIPEVTGEHYLIGAATHCLTLEGRYEFERQFVVGGPINPKTERPYGRETKAYEAWAAEQGKPCLSDEQFALVCQLASAVKSHLDAADILREGVAEGVVRRPLVGVNCQIRCDWFSPHHGLADLKTCHNLDDFEDDCLEYHYVEQMAFYRAVLREATRETCPVILISVEKQEPYRVGTWNIHAVDLDVAETANEEAIRELATCRSRDHWPTRYERRRELFA